MSISIVTWTLGLTAAQDVINKAQALGLDGIQYAGDHRDVDPIQLRNSAIQSGLEVIAVDPFNAGPTDPSTASAAGAVAYYKRVIDFAEILGTVPVTLQGLSLWTKNCDNRNDAKDQLLTCCEAVNRYAHERGVRTLYEVCNHYEVPLIHTAQECRELIEAVGEGNMGMILDSFHMNINEQDPLQAIRANLDLLEIYHISDSGRGGIGTGHINFRTHHRTLLEGGFAGHVAIEPVLAHLTPSNSPRFADDQAQLDAQIYHSASCWRSYSNDLPE